MRRPVAALAFLVALAMCAFLLGTGDPDRRVAAATTAQAGAIPVDTDTNLSPDTSALDNMTACQLVVTLATESPGVNVRVSVGNFRDEVADIDRSGCTITIGGSWKALGGGPSALDTISNVLTDHGWRDDPRYAEDTPGGTRFALTRGATICIFQGMWDPGNEADSTYVPSDEYTFIIRCATPHP